MDKSQQFMKEIQGMLVGDGFGYLLGLEKELEFAQRRGNEDKVKNLKIRLDNLWGAFAQRNQ